MPHLPTDLRNLLEKTVVEARDVTERGARAAIDSLGVSEPKVPSHLQPAKKELRVRLRARARQLGDSLDSKTDRQGVERLVREIAYEHWHQMLFARFLAESHLLVEPQSGVAVSLEECRELARERGEDPWALAGRFAERMLPAIFRSGDPALKLALPPERLNRLEALLEALPAEVFASDDALGWVYQFWQSKRKKEINASGRKIGAEELPAVTQLFTEPYMVQFLLHNTLGAWHAGKVLAARLDLATSATSEEELRRACALPGYEWTYLRFVRDPAESGPWRPAAGTFPGWPERSAQVTFLDPCCGSGHFLVEGFLAFVALRRKEEELDLASAVRVVLADNVRGLELDPRCTQLAAFAVAFAAWRKLGRVEPLPSIHIACSGLAVGVPKSEWLKLAGADPELRRGMDRLHELFQKAPTFGSLLDPRKEVGQDLFTASLERLEAHLIEAIGKEEVLRDAGATEVAVTAEGMARALESLLASYTLVATNVPFLSRSKQEGSLQAYLAKNFPYANQDLATAFLERCLALVERHGTVALVTPHNWYFLGVFARLRLRLLSERTFVFAAQLGPAAFQDMNWWAIKTVLSIVSAAPPLATSQISGLDLGSHRVTAEKEELVRNSPLSVLWQRGQRANPDARVTLIESVSGPLLGQVAEGLAGIQSGDYSRFGRVFWEIATVDGEKWAPQQSTVVETVAFGGRQHVLWWEGGKGELARSSGAFVRGIQGWGKAGVAVAQMGQLPVTLSSGQFWDNNTACVIPHDPRHLAAVWCFCSSPEFSKAVRRIDQYLKVTNATLVKVPFDLAHWEQVARERYPGGLPEPWSEDPRQWIFHGHPMRSSAPLQVAVARLLGYRWPAELDPGMRLSNEARQWVERSQGLIGFVAEDGIACLSSLREKEPAAVRLRALLAAAFGEKWNVVKERELLAATQAQSGSLEEWLRDWCFEEHCTLFHQRPFIWHIWDGRKDGFHALVNYHRLTERSGKGRQLLEALAFAYLGEWIDRQRRDAGAGETAAEARVASAVGLQEELKKILKGEGKLPGSNKPGYDIFVRWKPLHQQAMGWEPDVDDGVRINARPFLMAGLGAGRAGAGLFRSKPTIHWKKDRGAEPKRDQAEFPWFWEDGVFHGERHNDIHLTLEEKRRAREAAARGGFKR
jgi:hypothetical protein